MNHSFQVFNYFTTILPPRSQDKTGISSFFHKNDPHNLSRGLLLSFHKIPPLYCQLIAYQRKFINCYVYLLGPTTLFTLVGYNTASQYKKEKDFSLSIRLLL